MGLQVERFRPPSWLPGSAFGLQVGLLVWLWASKLASWAVFVNRPFELKLFDHIYLRGSAECAERLNSPYLTRVLACYKFRSLREDRRTPGRSRRMVTGDDSNSWPDPGKVPASILPEVWVFRNHSPHQNSEHPWLCPAPRLDTKEKQNSSKINQKSTKARFYCKRSKHLVTESFLISKM